MIVVVWGGSRWRILADKIISRRADSKYLDERQLTLSYCKNEFIAALAFTIYSGISALFSMLGCLFIDYNEYGLFMNFYISFLPYPDTTLIWLVNYICQFALVSVAAIFMTINFPVGLLLMNQTCLLVDRSLLQVKRLGEAIGNVSKGNEAARRVQQQQRNRSTADKIKIIIEATRQTQEWQGDVQNVMRYNFLSQVVGLSFLVGVALYATTLRPFEAHMIVATASGSLSQFFVFCWMGNRLTTRFEQLTEKLYDTDWYALPMTQQKDLQLIMVMTQNMRSYNGIFYDVNYETFVSVRN